MKYPSILALAGMYGGLTSLAFPDKDDLEGINIEKEMELIKQKKSKLSARLRRVVEYRYNKLERHC